LATAVDIEQLLQGASPDAPCGENLEYNPGFVELVHLAQGRAEQQMGDAVVPGAEPDWRAVGSKSIDFLTQTKDLRLAVYLTQALLERRGSPG
jgi:type VI secretion system protein ImpA